MGIAKARNHRKQRTAALRAIAAGRLPLRGVVRDGLGSLGSCPVHRVLEAAPTLGPEGVRKVLERSKVWPLLDLKSLSAQDRQAILHHLPERVR